MKEIYSSGTWRISKNGYSIKKGWGDEKVIIAKYPLTAYNADVFQTWLENAEHICELHNATLEAQEK